MFVCSIKLSFATSNGKTFCEIDPSVLSLTEWNSGVPNLNKEQNTTNRNYRSLSKKYLIDI